MKRILIYILCCFPVVAYGQSQMLSDTFRINEITVRESSLTSVISGFRNENVDSAALRENRLESLSELISENTTVFVKSYGPGSSATISFRGTGASHTQLLWNELSINSPMLGQADLSLIPAGFVDELRVFSGGASMVVGSGGLGGAVNVETKPEWSPGIRVLANAGAGSFGRYSGLIKARTGNEKFQSVTRAFLHTAQNNFTYLNTVGYPEPVSEQRQNASSVQRSVMQELYFKGKSSVTSASFWYQSSDRELPSTLLVPQPDGSEKQEDESFRAVLSHKKYLANAGYDAVFAWFTDRLNYLNIPASIDSRNRSNSLYAKAGAEAAIDEKTNIRLILNNEISFINSVNYSDTEARYIATATAAVRRVVGENLGTVLLIREIVDDFKPLIPDFSAGLDLRIFEKEEGFVRMNLSRNSKVPSMNDLYWNPGGNPDLRNEYSYTGELSFDLKGNITQLISYKAELAAYAGRIRDMIQWLPGRLSYWTPQNIAETSTHGLEADFGFGYRTGKFELKLNGLYSCTRATYVDLNGSNDGNQLIYVPVNMGNASIRTGYRNSYAGISASFTGKRFTTVDNDKFLPDYTITNFYIGYKVSPGSNSFDLSIKAENIFNEGYEIIAYYPMPGRSFLLSFTYQFNK